MKIFKFLAKTPFLSFFKIFFQKIHNELTYVENQGVNSAYLSREVKVDLYFPPQYQSKKIYPMICFNDGQDLERMRLQAHLDSLYKRGKIQPVIIVGIHAGDRMQEYGTAHTSDYKNRGSKANSYSCFIVEELLPFLSQKFKVSTNPKLNAFAGFSLGGLSAFDIAWNHSKIFGNVGVFSGALWWRSKAFKAEDPDADRIVHELIAKSIKKRDLRFWLQTGTNDETEDRNNNGVIDAIDDTLDLIKALKVKGYAGETIEYVEVEGGEHTIETWREVMEDFLTWLEN